jgi:hypothetical protein
METSLSSLLDPVNMIGVMVRSCPAITLKLLENDRREPSLVASNTYLPGFTFKKSNIPLLFTSVDIATDKSDWFNKITVAASAALLFCKKTAPCIVDDLVWA